MRFENLPRNWIVLSLNELFSVVTGSTPSTVVKEYWNDGEIKWITPKDLGKFYGTHISESGRKITKQGLLNCSATIVPRDSIIVSTRAPIGYLAILNEPMCFNQGCKALVKKNAELNSKFYFYYLHTKVGEMNRLGSGSTFKEISKSQISNLKFPLPPMPEQHRIVAKLEELFTKLDVSVAELKKAKAQIKRYRQSVLKHAFEGKLTEQWRIANGELRNKTAEELLAKIKEERKKALGKKYKELPPVDTTNLPQLPEGWVWVRIDDISQVISGNAFKSTDFIDSGIPVVKIGNVGYGEFIWKDQEYFPKERFKGVKDFEIKSGDLLFALTRPITNNRTKVCLYPTDSQIGLLNQRVAVIKTSEIVIKNYLLYFLQSEDFKSKIKLLFTETLQPNLSPIDLKEVKIPFTSFNELNQIVLEIERHFSVADETEKIIDQSLKQAERLRQSILKDAFSGKLVPQDPSDEPASLLLEKIKTEKEKLAKEPKTKKSNRRTGRKVVGEVKAEREKISETKSNSQGLPDSSKKENKKRRIK